MKLINWFKEDLWNWVKGDLWNWIKSIPSRLFHKGVRCVIRMEENWLTPSLLMAGLSFFVLMVSYFGLRNLSECTAAEIVFTLALPGVIMVSYMALMRGLRFPVTPVYGVMSALLCVVLCVQTFLAGGVWNIILWTFLYLLLGAISICSAFGWFRYPRFTATAYLSVAGIHFLFKDIPSLLRLEWLSFLNGLAVVAGLLAFGILGLAFKNVLIARHRFQ